MVAVDLDTRRVRTFLENVRYATLGPDGALYAVDTASAVTQLVRRTPVRFRAKLQGKPSELYGTMDGALIAAPQKVEHYEIASYGSPRTRAHEVGRPQVAELLQATLDEEAETDRKLSRLAESLVNQRAA